MRRHAMWDTGWERFRVRKMIEGASPEQKILLLGLYRDTREEEENVHGGEIEEYVDRLLGRALGECDPDEPHT